MGVDQFLLTWNNHRSNFAEVFSQLRVQDQLVDVTLLCDGGSFPAHRLVLAACSPYFHQLFTHLPTQHPIVYLRDVRQTELEALLEFIYKGEVSVANSELTGLIKIAESLRIKGLGDVSQRDPTSFNKPEKRSGTPYSNSSSPNSCGRPRKLPRMNTNSHTTANTENKHTEDENISPSIFSSASNYSLRTPTALPNLLETAVFTPTQVENHDSRDSLTPSPFKESKLRSCLEGQEHSSFGGLTFHNFLAHHPSSSHVSNFLRREEKKKALKGKGKQISSLFNTEVDKDEKTLFSNIKQENVGGEDPSSPPDPLEQQDPFLLSHLPVTKLYETGAFRNTFLNKYTQLLNSFHQQQQLQTQPQEQEQPNDDSSLSSSLIPTTDHPIPPSPKDPKSLTCHLCGATIKHIANFRRHMKQHLNPRRFPCPWCSAAFGRKDNLKTHTRKHHPLEVEIQEQSASSSLIGASEGIANDSQRDEEVYNGIEGEASSPINEDEDSVDPTGGEDEGLIIVDEGDDEEKMRKEEEEESRDDGSVN